MARQQPFQSAKPISYRILCSLKLGYMLCDLLTRKERESTRYDGALVFDIGLLADRLFGDHAMGPLPAENVETSLWLFWSQVRVRPLP